MSTVNQLLAELKKIPVKEIYDTLEGSDEWEFLREESEDENGNIDEDLLEEKQTEWLEDRLEEIEGSILTLAEEEGGKLVIYRALTVEDAEVFASLLATGEGDPNFQGKVGIYWSYDEKSADTHWGDYSKKQNVVLKGAVDINAINVPVTLELLCNPSLGDDEREIRLKEGAKVELLGAYIQSGGKWNREGNYWAENETEEPIYVSAAYPSILHRSVKP